MTLKSQQFVFMLAEIANAWSAIEVFLLSVVASMLELSQFAKFMVGNHCDFMKDQFFQDLLDGQSICFNVRSIVGFNVVYLCIGVGLLNFCVFTGLRLAHDALEERMVQEAGQEENQNLVETLHQRRSSKFLHIARWKLTSFIIKDADLDVADVVQDGQSPLML
eukprot:CAMPEP_0197253692 /NCGR_PEP_ID=MMETSP1429-20130617/65979_1 /TAXON_ID=49237 /ORGANISM="Chaetoceros  sp., Strain UNC1202" /LENGTH=163 /DNA_ID=CAMNT_0042716461 /DNA_START=413 /DNA_END=904 /DNA_ORIENTATION=+